MPRQDEEDYIEQVVYTHCTAATSVFGNGCAETILGYDVRAASLDNDRLQARLQDTVYSLVAHEYSLPKDASAKDAERFTSHSAPTRLFFFPKSDSISVAGCVSHRNCDALGRINANSIAHYLLIPGHKAVNAIAVLRSWGSSSWITEDTSFPKELPTIQGLEAFLSTAVHEDVLLSFLLTPSEGQFHDPGGVITHLCREASPHVRQELLRLVLRGTIEALSKRKSVMLVSDPEVACLLFFGVLRLLPVCALTERISFSTYETNIAASSAQMIATTFVDPESHDISPDDREHVGFWLNTFHGMAHANFIESHHLYSAFILDLLVAEGWDAADRILSRFSKMRICTSSDLDECVEAHLKSSILFSADPRPANVPPCSTRDEHYLLLRIDDECVGKYSDSEQRVRAQEIVSLPHGKELINRLTASYSSSTIPPFVSFALQECPVDYLVPVILNGRVPISLRALSLARYADESEAMSKDVAAFVCESFSGEKSMQIEALLLQRKDLTARAVVSLFRCFQQMKCDAMPFMRTVLTSCHRNVQLRKALSVIVDNWTFAEVRDGIQRHGEQLIRAYSGARVSAVIKHILARLPDSSNFESFEADCAVLESAAPALEVAFRRDIDRWGLFRKALKELVVSFGSKARRRHRALDSCAEVFETLTSSCGGAETRQYYELLIRLASTRVGLSRRSDFIEVVKQTCCRTAIRRELGMSSCSVKAEVFAAKRSWLYYKWIEMVGRIRPISGRAATLSMVRPDNWMKDVTVSLTLEVTTNRTRRKTWTLTRSQPKLVMDPEDVGIYDAGVIGTVTAFTVEIEVASPYFRAEKVCVSRPSFDLRARRLQVELKDREGRVHTNVEFLDGLLSRLGAAGGVQ